MNKSTHFSGHPINKKLGLSHKLCKCKTCRFANLQVF